MSNWGRNIIKAKWTDKHDISFLAGIKLTIDSPDDMFEGVFKLYIPSTRELNDLKERLRAIPGVITVKRIQEIEGDT